MGERESHRTSVESRRDVAARPVTRQGHEEAMQRYLGAALYHDLKETDLRETRESGHEKATSHTE